MAQFETANSRKGKEMPNPEHEIARDEAVFAYSDMERPDQLLLDVNTLNVWLRARALYEKNISQPEAMATALKENGFADPDNKRTKAHSLFLTKAFLEKLKHEKLEKAA